MFDKILIANRGEIACRVIRTARRLGVRTAAVYSDADAAAPHVRLADEAHRVGPPPARESYLDGEAILRAALAAGAQAIHPGYGFLSENEEFAAACAKAGLVFIGPSPQAIAAMGDKSAAKRLMEKAGVPLVPGYHGEKQDPAFLESEAARIGFPVLIKPSAGGGGKGMRVVGERAAFRGALEAARREAAASFGDDRVLVERYLERPRHIEVQVFGDSRGNVLHLFERDCSVQRRHQKVLEEAPAPGLGAARRKEMGDAAVAAARAISYSGAGTVEFIAEQDGRFYFMEMNTRLQVEHPVTEMITGLDLVEWQLRVAAGEPLPLAQDAVRMQGHAIEARLYAEDPQRDFLPATGRLHHLRFPEPAAGVRVDAGVQEGGEVPAWYDPMIAKLIVHGPDRAAALAKLEHALGQVEVSGVVTNVRFLRLLARCPAFREATLDTGLIERNREQLFPAGRPAAPQTLATAAFAELAAQERATLERAMRGGDPHSPWNAVDGWRLNQEAHHDFTFVHEGVEHPVRLRFAAEGLLMEVAGQAQRLAGESLADGRVSMRLGDRTFQARAVRSEGGWHVFCDGEEARLALKPDLPGADEDPGLGSLAAPMPGKVIQVLVKPGERVAKGAALMILEAMKMEHTVAAPADGVVREILFGAGEQVAEGAQLLLLDPA